MGLFSPSDVISLSTTESIFNHFVVSDCFIDDIVGMPTELNSKMWIRLSSVVLAFEDCDVYEVMGKSSTYSLP